MSLNKPAFCSLFIVAIQRLYEGQRRAVIDMRPENSERSQNNELKKKFRARRERVCFVLYLHVFVLYGLIFSCMHGEVNLFRLSYERNGKLST